MWERTSLPFDPYFITKIRELGMEALIDVWKEGRCEIGFEEKNKLIWKKLNVLLEM